MLVSVVAVGGETPSQVPSCRKGFSAQVSACGAGNPGMSVWESNKSRIEYNGAFEQLGINWGENSYGAMGIETFS